ncbi:hypothetical protein LUZ62_034757 [Rhynchospora pubera]|uniref:Gustatory receptor n=2 Tax=Rhynchospora pubera TaxID=906938 RepID=A0AAV8EX83_9POAL|nr:hypothetical protein LUZ62_034757 [Rhynchospora pubera]
METNAASASDAEHGGDHQTARVPLLLSRAYARCKSTMNDELKSFRVCLKCCLLDHSSLHSIVLSFSAFFLFTFIVPLATSLSIITNTTPSSVVSFHRLAQLPTSGLATIAFIIFTAFIRRHGGLRRLLFLDDGMQRDTSLVRRRYAIEINRTFRRHLALILLPSFSLELAHKIVLFSSVHVRMPFFTDALHNINYDVSWRAVVFLLVLASWIYRTTVFLLVCVLFRLTCELQILRFEGLYEMFKVDRSEVEWAEVIFKEHGRIKMQLLETSHRYRAFLIACMVAITVSQLGTLILVLSSKAPKDFCNTGDLLVCSVVQLSGFVMCLFGAARITHRAQRVVSIASKWHIRMSCLSKCKHVSDSTEEDGYTSDYDHPAYQPAQHGSKASNNMQLSSMEETAASSIRQALVTYLHYNSGGITIFGFALDRGLLHTLFAFEMTLVLWILSKVVVLS